MSTHLYAYQRAYSGVAPTPTDFIASKLRRPLYFAYAPPTPSWPAVAYTWNAAAPSMLRACVENKKKLNKNYAPPERSIYLAKRTTFEWKCSQTFMLPPIAKRACFSAMNKSPQAVSAWFDWWNTSMTVLAIYIRMKQNIKEKQFKQSTAHVIDLKKLPARLLQYSESAQP